MARPIIVFALLLPIAAGAADLEKRFDLSLTAGMALPGRIEASWYDDFDPAYTDGLTTSIAPVARISATWWPQPRLAWVAPTISVHYAALFLPAPYNMGFWDGRDHWISDDGIHFAELEAGVRLEGFRSRMP